MSRNNYGAFETEAVNTLLRRMGTAITEVKPEEIARVCSYSEAALNYDLARIRLEESAKKNNIKELTEKYNPVFELYSVALRELAKASNIDMGVTDIKIGDQLTVALDGFGEFTATVHKVTDEGIMYIFDDCITRRPMNENGSNEGGFEKSDLKKWMDTKLLNAFPASIRDRVKNLTLPSVGEITGWEDEWDREHFEPDNDEQLPLMKKCRNRVPYLDNEPVWGWLRNATKKEFSSAYFAYVYFSGSPGSYGASGSFGVRPAFWLVK